MLFVDSLRGCLVSRRRLTTCWGLLYLHFLLWVTPLGSSKILSLKGSRVLLFGHATAINWSDHSWLSLMVALGFLFKRWSDHRHNKVVRHFHFTSQFYHTRLEV